MSRSTRWIVAAFLFASPPERIASATALVGASAMAAKLLRPKAASSERFAPEEFLPEVFWERMVPMRDSMTLGTLPQVFADNLYFIHDKR